MSTDDLPEAIATKVRPVFRLRAMTVDDDKPLSGFLPDGPDVAGAVRVSPQKPSERQKEKLHRQKEWDRLDREYAEINLKKIASVQPEKSGVYPAAAARSIEYWTWHQVLSWIKHRCREKLKVTGTSWYDDDDRLRLTAAIQRGEINCFDPDSWLKVPQHRAFDREREPNVLFRADDVIALWPAAFLKPFAEVVAEYYRRFGKSPTADLSDEKEVVIEPLTRSKMMAIVACIKRGDRPKGRYKQGFPKPNGRVSRMGEFAYRIQLEVLSDRRDRHNAEVTKRRAAKADLEKIMVIKGAIPNDTPLVSSKLQPQAREFEAGFDAGRIRHLLLDLEKNKHPWLIEGTEIQRLLDSSGKPPPDIDNELCEALSLDVENGPQLIPGQ